MHAVAKFSGLTARGSCVHLPGWSTLQLQMEHHCSGFLIWHLSKAVWAYAKLELVPAAGIMAGLQARCLAQVKEFDPMGLSNVMWGMAKISASSGDASAASARPPPELAAAFQKQALATVLNFNSQDIANVLWAMAKFHTAAAQGDERHRTVVRALQAQLVSCLSTQAGLFKAQELSVAMWAFAKMQVPSEGPTDRPTDRPTD